MRTWTPYELISRGLGILSRCAADPEEASAARELIDMLDTGLVAVVASTPPTQEDPCESTS